MKKIIVLWTFLFTIVVFSQEEKDTDFLKLKGKVKSVITTEYGLGDPYVSSRLFFNKDGYLTEQTYLSMDGSGFSTLRFYNDKGQKIESKHSFDLKNYEKATYEYDTAGNLVRSISYDKKGTPNGKEIFIYNDANLKIEEIIYGAKNSLIKHCFFTYNSSNQLINKREVRRKNVSEEEI